MDLLTIVNAAAAATTIVAAIMIASNYSPRTMVAGFSIFVVSSALWMLSGHLDAKPSLAIQNGVLLLVNIFGIVRWLPKT